MKKNQKKKFIILSTLVLTILIGSTYALWMLTRYQTNENTLVSNKCFKVDIVNESNDIDLLDQYPISPEKGAKLTPYTFTIENTCNLDAVATISLEVLDTTTLKSKYIGVQLNNQEYINLSNFETQTPVLSGATESRILLRTKLSADNSKTYNLRIWMDGENTFDLEDSMNKVFNAKIAVTSSVDMNDPTKENRNVTLAHAMLVDMYEGSTVAEAKSQIEAKEKPNFDVIADTDEGLFAMEDDLGTSYYYRGNINYNWVYFAGYYWRIIRQNGDGSVRMIYNGPTPVQEGNTTQIGTSVFNSKSNDPTYVGYTYGNNLGLNAPYIQSNDNDSTIKMNIETWFKNNIEIRNIDYLVADEPFCNDRTVTYGNGYSNDAQTNYGPYTRLQSGKSTKQPLLTCLNKNDKFTVSNTLGNGKNNKPVGLITADEVALAGGLHDSENNSYYLYTGQYYWTLSPYIFNGTNAYEWGVYSSGIMYNSGVNNVFGVRPVINLKSDALVYDGNGTTDNPYKILEYRIFSDEA